MAHTGLCRKVDDQFWLALLKCGRNGLCIFKHEFMAGKLREFPQHGMACVFQRHVIIGDHAVYARDLMTFTQQAPGNVKADEPGRAGNKNAHPQLQKNVAAGKGRACLASILRPDAHTS